MPSRKSWLVIGGCAGLILCLFAGFFVAKKYVETRKKRVVVDRFLAEIVGENDLKENYQFVSYNKGFDYLSYRFLPGDKYDSMKCDVYYRDAVKFLSECSSFPCDPDRLHRNEIARIKAQYASFPSCEKDRNHCQFKVNLEQLKDIARQKEMAETVRFVMYNDAVVAELGRCGRTSEGDVKILVDMQDGAVKWEGRNEHCRIQTHDWICTF